MGLAARLDEYQPRLTRLLLLMAMIRVCLHIVLLHSRDAAWGLQSVCTCVLTGVQHVVLMMMRHFGIAVHNCTNSYQGALYSLRSLSPSLSPLSCILVSSRMSASLVRLPSVAHHCCLYLIHWTHICSIMSYIWL